MSKKQKRMLFRVLASAVLFAVALLLPTEGWLRLFTFLIPYAVIAWDVLWRAVRNIAHGQVFDENFLMSLATVGALATGEYPEAVFVMLFYQVGELFQSYAVDQSRKSITSLMDIRPDYANIEVDGQLRQVDPEDVAVGDTIVIKAGERIPLDGVVLEGTSNVDTAALTGESLPREAQPGDDVISGCVNLSGLLRVRVTKAFEESTVAKILDLVENSSSKKAKAENFITKFARYYTPAVVLAAALVAVDQVVKYLVRAGIPLHTAVDFLPGLDLTYVQNTGAAFSLFSEHTWLLTLISLVMSVLLLMALVRGFFRHPFGRISLALLLAGAVGNLIDRAFQGYVVDMFHVLFMEFAVFNVADICVVVGGIAAAVYYVWGYERLEKGLHPQEHRS